MLIKSKTLVLIIGVLWVVGLAGAADAPVVYTNKDLPLSGSATPADADASDTAPSVDDSAEAPAAAPEGAFTNDDLGRLAPAGNSTLPELGDDTNPPAGPAEAPAPVAADTTASIEWLDALGRRMQLNAAIADAERRVRAASAKLERLAGGLRPKGSAFESGRVTTEDLYVYDINDHGSKRDAMLAELRGELDAARVELSKLLTTQ